MNIRSSVWRMYRDAADEDYLLARYSARSNLVYQFWWNAQQALEKYLKATLLLNNIPTTKFGHSLLEMYDISFDLADGLLPLVSCPPQAFRRRDKFSKNPRGFQLTSDFIRAVETNGNPNNRYRIFSTYVRPHSLVIFDEICFLLRRIAFPLEIQLSDGSGTARSVLTAQREIQLHPTMGFEKSLSKKYSPIWREHFEWCNFAYFYREAVAAGEMPHWGGSINAEPSLLMETSSKVELDALEWIAKCSFPKKLRQEVLQSVQEERRKQIKKLST